MGVQGGSGGSSAAAGQSCHSPQTCVQVDTAAETAGDGRSECETESWPAQPSTSLFPGVTVHAGPFSPSTGPVAAWPDPRGLVYFFWPCTCSHADAHMHVHAHTHTYTPGYSHMGRGLVCIPGKGLQAEQVVGGRPQAGFQRFAPLPFGLVEKGMATSVFCLENTDRGAGGVGHD